MDESEASASRIEVVQKVLSKVINRALQSKSTVIGSHHHRPSSSSSWIEDPESSLLTRSDSLVDVRSGPKDVSISLGHPKGYHQHNLSTSSTLSSSSQVHYHHHRNDTDVILS